MRLWKVFKKGMKSNHGNIKWKLNKWNHNDGFLLLCDSRFHASRQIIQAMIYTDAEIIARVEVGDDFIECNDKLVCRDMRVIKTYKWTRKQSISLAIFAAELVIDNYEKVYPIDDRPRKAIEAAKAVLKSDTKKNRDLAKSAEWLVEASAVSAKWSSELSAAWSAWSAASSARSAWLEVSSKSSARSSVVLARSAISKRSEIYNKCEKHIHELIGYKGE